MLAQQLELLKPEPPAVSDMDLAWMVGALRGNEWMTAADLGAKDEAAKRVLRAIASASKAQIISGQKGYRLGLEATLPEIDTARANLLSQKMELERRIAELDQLVHGRRARESHPTCTTPSVALHAT